MDQELSDQLTQAIIFKDKAEKEAGEAQRQVSLLQRAWCQQLIVGDIVKHWGDKCIVSDIDGDRITILDTRRPSSKKDDSIRGAAYEPWTEADEAAYQLKKRKMNLLGQIEQLPESRIAELEGLLLKSD